jgi:hypothetical protein
MALTQATLLKLEGKGFDALYTDNIAEWTAMAEKARELMASRISKGDPTVDDIKKILGPLVEIHPKLTEFLGEKRLTQKYWIGHFTDYILHRIYNPKLEKKGDT